jgi:hypothetical protein
MDSVLQKPWLGGDNGIRRGGEAIGGVRAATTFDGEDCGRGSDTDEREVTVWVWFREGKGIG